MEQRIEKLYRVNGVTPCADDVCVVDMRSMSLIQGGAIFRLTDGLEMAQKLNTSVGAPYFTAVPTADCGRYTTRGSRVIREKT